MHNGELLRHDATNPAWGETKPLESDVTRRVSVAVSIDDKRAMVPKWWVAFFAVVVKQWARDDCQFKASTHSSEPSVVAWSRLDFGVVFAASRHYFLFGGAGEKKADDAWTESLFNVGKIRIKRDLLQLDWKTVGFEND